MGVADAGVRNEGAAMGNGNIYILYSAEAETGVGRRRRVGWVRAARLSEINRAGAMSGDNSKIRPRKSAVKDSHQKRRPRRRRGALLYKRGAEMPGYQRVPGVSKTPAAAIEYHIVEGAMSQAAERQGPKSAMRNATV